MDHPIDHFYKARITRAAAAPEEPNGGNRNRFEFHPEASNNGLDYYCTHMNERTLSNFAQDGESGVQFLDSHNARNLGYGRSYGGRIETIPGLVPNYALHGRDAELAFTPPAEYLRATIDAFTVRGIKFGGGLTYDSTDDFIRAVEAEIVRDVSVGFGQGNYICDICGNNYRNFQSCNHLAGLIYPSGANDERRILATVEIDDAHLFELSAVYDGATPNAMIRKAEELTRAGEVDQTHKQLFEARYRVHLPEIPKIYGGVSVREAPTAQITPNGGNSMDLLEQLRQALGSTAEGADLLTDLRSKLDQIAQLEPLAADGRTYRSDLVNLAIAEGVRAHGTNFDEANYRVMLDTASLEFIKRMTADFARLADAALPSGRQTSETHEPPNQREAVETAVPDSLFTS